MIFVINRVRGTIGAFTFALAVALAIGTAVAGAGDYRFELAQAEIKSGADREVAIRLIHAPSGKHVANAVLFQAKLDMSPMGMADMTAKTTPVKADGAGIYTLRASLEMEGDWALHIAAKVPGETETVRRTLRFKVLK